MYAEFKKTLSRSVTFFLIAAAGMTAAPMTANAMDWYIGGGIGEAHHEATGGDIAGPGFLGSIDGSEGNSKIFLGMELWDKYVGAEFGYVDLGTAEAKGTIASSSVKGSSRATAYTAALVGQIPVGNFGVLVKLGVSGVKATLTTSGTGVLPTNHSTDVKIFGGGGFQYYLSKKSIIRFEAERFNMGSVGSPYVNTLTVNYIYRFGK